MYICDVLMYAWIDGGMDGCMCVDGIQFLYACNVVHVCDVCLFVRACTLRN